MNGGDKTSKRRETTLLRSASYGGQAARWPARNPDPAGAGAMGLLFRLRSLSFRWRIVLLATGAIVLTCMLITALTFGPTLNQIESSMDRSGIAAAEVLAALGPAAAGPGEEPRIDREILKPLLLRDGLREELIDAAITVPGGAVSARGQKSSLVDRRRLRGLPGAVEVYASTYLPGAGREPVPVREYVRTFPARDGSTGTAYVLLSAARLEEAPSLFTTRTFLAAVLAAVLGSGLALLTGAYISRPLRRLVDVMRAVRKGDLSRRAAPGGPVEVARLASAFNAMVENLEHARKTEIESEVLKREVDMAAKIQANLIPRDLPTLPGWDLAGRYRPYGEVGGDLLDAVPLADGRHAVLVADVSGKGLPGCLVMAIARSYFRAEAPTCRNTRELLVRMNRHLCRDIPRGMFVTAIVLAVNPSTGTVEIGSAGHGPLVLARAGGRECGLVNTAGLALGFHDGPLFESRLRPAAVEMAPDDRLLLYTDGLVEAMDPAGEEFGVGRLCALVRSYAAAPSESLLSLLILEVERFCGEAGRGDDISLFTLRRAGASRQPPLPVATPVRFAPPPPIRRS